MLQIRFVVVFFLVIIIINFFLVRFLEMKRGSFPFLLLTMKGLWNPDEDRLFLGVCRFWNLLLISYRSWVFVTFEVWSICKPIIYFFFSFCNEQRVWWLSWFLDDLTEWMCWSVQDRMTSSFCGCFLSTFFNSRFLIWVSDVKKLFLFFSCFESILDCRQGTF